MFQLPLVVFPAPVVAAAWRLITAFPIVTTCGVAEATHLPPDARPPWISCV